MYMLQSLFNRYCIVGDLNNVYLFLLFAVTDNPSTNNLVHTTILFSFLMYHLWVSCDIIFIINKFPYQILFLFRSKKSAGEKTLFVSSEKFILFFDSLFPFILDIKVGAAYSNLLSASFFLSKLRNVSVS